MPPSTLLWSSLVERSISSWDNLSCLVNDQTAAAKDLLQSYSSLDEFLINARNPIMFWFFQLREAFLAQAEMIKWNPHSLDEYVLLPTFPELVSSRNCLFLSHFWQSKHHPDPDGQSLHQFQQQLRLSDWSYVWVDWTCTPQAPRNLQEEYYFTQSLLAVSALVQICKFAWLYPRFEPRMWVLYEVAIYTLTRPAESVVRCCRDMQTFTDHVMEMVEHGVRSVLEKYCYRCTCDYDTALLSSWLELLVLMRRLRIGVDDGRRLLGHIIWFPSCEKLCTSGPDGVLELAKYQGTLTINGKRSTFTPFPN